MRFDEARTLVESVPHWHHRFEIFPGLVTPGAYDPKFLIDKLRLPDSLHGLRVLDIGASDGFYSLECRRRGAEVVAIDYRAKAGHGFAAMEAIAGVEIRYIQMNLYDMPAHDLGTFDIVLFMGVLYHLPDMLRALHAVRAVCRGTLFLETHSENAFCPDIAAARYYQGASLAGDITNFWSPNRLCVLDMLRDAGFVPSRDDAWGDRLMVEAKAGEDFGKLRIAYGNFPA